MKNATYHKKIFFFKNADQVEIGYEVLVHESDEPTPSVVINVSNLPMQGSI